MSSQRLEQMQFFRRFVVLSFGWLVLALPTLAGAADDAAPVDPEKLAFFENKVRPLLVENCHSCHGPDKHKGGLRLDSHAALMTGGDSGAIIEPGNPDGSLLVSAISYRDASLQMPPKGKLSDEQISILTRWVKMGAPWPKMPDAPGTGGPSVRKTFEITAEDRNYWAYRPISRPQVPTVASNSPVLPIDAFILARLNEKGLIPNAQATPREIVRRAYFDLIGLPPSPEEISAFESDRSPQAFEKLVDRLLARPEYGERWGRYWLDVVRFAQTSGYERDDEIPYAWRYRDYVIKAFNDDKPYDRFIMEQLAGDELAPDSPEAKIATGFYRIGTWDDEPDDARAAEFDNLDDIIVTTSAAFLGSTLGCARCHDHKLDPFSQSDYYKLVSVFRNLRPYERPRRTLDSPTLFPLEPAEKVAAWRAEHEAARTQFENQLKNASDDASRKRIREEIAREDRREFPGEWALVARDRGGKPATTNILVRGNAGQPGAEVTPGLPGVLGGQPLTPLLAKETAPAAGLRLAFARWVASKENPLTARVLVNRVWQHHFGQGLVKTSTDFGKGGMPPTHPELIDWLAAEFIESGWSMKQLHKRILMSQAWQRSSRAEQVEGMRADPGNDWLWRQNLRRLEAEAIRDTLLAVSGSLNPASGGRGYFPDLSGEVLAGQSRPGNGWEISPSAEKQRRSIYAFVKRSVLVPLLEMFDYSNVNQPLGERQNTTVAPQALMMLNDEFLQERSLAFAARLTKEVGADTDARIGRAYQLAMGREPTPRERQVAREYLARLMAEYSQQANQVTFRPDVPDSLHRSYLSQLKAVAMLKGPSTGWKYFTGRWHGNYEGIAQMDVQRGPFALLAAEMPAEGTLSGLIQLYQASEFASLLVRGRGEGDLYEGYEIQLDPREERVRILRVAADKIQTLAETKFPVPTSRSLPIRLELEGSVIRLWLGDQAKKPDPSTVTLSARDEQPLAVGRHVGVRAVGAPLRLDQMKWVSGDTVIDLAHPPTVAADPENRDLAGWTTLGGQWSRLAEGGIVGQPAPGAKLVWNGPRLTEGALEAEFQIGAQGGDVGFCLGVTDARDGVDALQAWNINVRLNALRVGRHDNNWRAVKSTPLSLEADTWHRIRVEVAGQRLAIWINGGDQPRLEYDLPQPLTTDASQVALRTFQSRFSIRNLKVTQGPHTFYEPFQAEPAQARPSTRPDTPVDMTRRAEQQAWETLCLTILNLNEVVYVD